MTRRGVIAALLMSTVGQLVEAQQNTGLGVRANFNGPAHLRIVFGTGGIDQLRLAWSDGTETVLTEAEIRESLQ